MLANEGKQAATASFARWVLYSAMLLMIPKPIKQPTKNTMQVMMMKGVMLKIPEAVRV